MDVENQEVPMSKHRTITGFVAVALVAVATTAAIRSHSPWIDGTSLLKGFKTDINMAPKADFEDRWSAMFAGSPVTDTTQH